jgi:outer membrane lipoprotein carrier protein
MEFSMKHPFKGVLSLAVVMLLGLMSADLAAGKSGNARGALDFFLKDLSTFSASFEQTVFDEAGELLETSHGTVCISRPGKFAWDYQAPYQQSIVSNGKTLWLYDADLAQVTINAIDTSAAGSAAQLLGNNVNIDEQYKVVELGVRDGADWLKLTPKTADQQYSAVEIGLHDKTLVGIKLLDNLGQVTALAFSNLRRNPPLPDTQFTFLPPPNVDVVTGAGDSATSQ